MWLVNPKAMCRRHLLGEHVEMHMFVGALNKGTRIDRYVAENMVEFEQIRSRHDQLAREMEARGYNHESPLPNIMSAGQVSPEQRQVKIDRAASAAELARRCPECRRMATTEKDLDPILKP